MELRNIPNDHIMVPQDWSVVQNALCGNGEVVEVTACLDRFSTKTTVAIWRNLLSKEEHLISILKRARFGMFYMLWQRLVLTAGL